MIWGENPLFLETPNNSKTKELKTWDFAQVFSIQASSDAGLVGLSEEFAFDGKFHIFSGAPPLAPPTKINMYTENKPYQKDVSANPNIDFQGIP